MKDVMIRRDGRVELFGEMKSEVEAVKKLTEMGYQNMVAWVKAECKSGRRFCKARGMDRYDENGQKV